MSVKVDIAAQYKWPGDGEYFIRLAQLESADVDYDRVMTTQAVIQVTGTKQHAQNQQAHTKAREADKARRVQVLLEVESKPKARSKIASKPKKNPMPTGQVFQANCGSSEREQINTWLEDAYQWVLQAEMCNPFAKEASSICVQLAALWFNPSDYDGGEAKFASSVTATLTRMKMHWKDTDFDCDPALCRSKRGEGVYAFVYPGDRTQTVHMCPFTFSTDNEAEKRQTLVHELSHFNFIGVNEMGERQKGEMDFYYGEGDAVNAAQANPIKAMNNADNIGYFIRDIGLKVGGTGVLCPTWAPLVVTCVVLVLQWSGIIR